MPWTKPIKGLINEVKIAQEQNLKEVAFKAIRGVVIRTPIDQGELVNNWQITDTAPSTVALPAPTQGGNEGMRQNVISRETSKLEKLATTKPLVFYISNPAPHAPYIELGTDKIPAYGMVAATLASLKL